MKVVSIVGSLAFTAGAAAAGRPALFAPRDWATWALLAGNGLAGYANQASVGGWVCVSVGRAAHWPHPHPPMRVPAQAGLTAGLKRARAAPAVALTYLG